MILTLNEESYSEVAKLKGGVIFFEAWSGMLRLGILRRGVCVNEVKLDFDMNYYSIKLLRIKVSSTGLKLKIIYSCAYLY